VIRELRNATCSRGLLIEAVALLLALAYSPTPLFRRSSAVIGPGAACISDPARTGGHLPLTSFFFSFTPIRRPPTVARSISGRFPSVYVNRQHLMRPPLARIADLPHLSFQRPVAPAEHPRSWRSPFRRRGASCACLLLPFYFRGALPLCLFVAEPDSASTNAPQPTTVAAGARRQASARTVRQNRPRLLHSAAGRCCSGKIELSAVPAWLARPARA